MKKEVHQITGTHIYATIWGLGKMVLLSVWKTAALHSPSGFQCVHGWWEKKRQLLKLIKELKPTANVLESVSPSHYFDRVLFRHDVVEPGLDVGKLVQQLVLDAFDDGRFQLDAVGHIFLFVKSETGFLWITPTQPTKPRNAAFRRNVKLHYKHRVADVCWYMSI